MHQPIDSLRVNTTLILAAQALLPYKEYFDGLYDLEYLHNNRLCSELTREAFVEGFHQLIRMRNEEEQNKRDDTDGDNGAAVSPSKTTTSKDPSATGGGNATTALSNPAARENQPPAPPNADVSTITVLPSPKADHQHVALSAFTANTAMRYVDEANWGQGGDEHEMDAIRSSIRAAGAVPHLATRDNDDEAPSTLPPQNMPAVAPPTTATITAATESASAFRAPISSTTSCFRDPHLPQMVEDETDDRRSRTERIVLSPMVTAHASHSNFEGEVNVNTDLLRVTSPLRRAQSPFRLRIARDAEDGTPNAEVELRGGGRVLETNVSSPKVQFPTSAALSLSGEDTPAAKATFMNARHKFGKLLAGLRKKSEPKDVEAPNHRDGLPSEELAHETSVAKSVGDDTSRMATTRHAGSAFKRIAAAANVKFKMMQLGRFSAGGRGGRTAPVATSTPDPSGGSQIVEKTTGGEGLQHSAPHARPGGGGMGSRSRFSPISNGANSRDSSSNSLNGFDEAALEALQKSQEILAKFFFHSQAIGGGASGSAEEGGARGNSVNTPTVTASAASFGVTPQLSFQLGASPSARFTQSAATFGKVSGRPEGGAEGESQSASFNPYKDEGYEDPRCDLSHLYDALLSIKRSEIREYLRRAKGFYYEADDQATAQRAKHALEARARSFTYADLLVFFDWSCAGIGAALRVTPQERVAVTRALERAGRHKVGVIKRVDFIEEYVKEVTKDCIQNILDALFVEDFDMDLLGDEDAEENKESNETQTQRDESGVRHNETGVFDPLDAKPPASNIADKPPPKDKHFASAGPKEWKPPQTLCPVDFNQYLKAIDSYHEYVAAHQTRPPEETLLSVGSKYAPSPEYGENDKNKANESFKKEVFIADAKALLGQTFEDVDEEGLDENAEEENPPASDVEKLRSDEGSNATLAGLAATTRSQRSGKSASRRRLDARTANKCHCKGVLHVYSEQIAFASDRIGKGLPSLIRSELRHAGYSVASHKIALDQIEGKHDNKSKAAKDGRAAKGVTFFVPVNPSNPNNPTVLIPWEEMTKIVGKAYLRWIHTPDAAKDETYLKMKADVKHVCLRLFPNDDMSPAVLSRLLDMLEKRPDLNTFTHSYSAMKAQKSRDYWDLFLFALVIVFYIVLAFSGRGLWTGQYDGYGVLHGYKNGRDATEFFHCTTENDRYPNGTLASTVFYCPSSGDADAEPLTLDGLVKQSDINSFIGSFIPNFLWPTEGKIGGATKISASLTPIGALRIRQRRVSPQVVERRIQIPITSSGLSDPPSYDTFADEDASVVYGYPFISDTAKTESKSFHGVLVGNPIIEQYTVVDHGGPLGDVDGGTAALGGYGGTDRLDCGALESLSYTAMTGVSRSYGCGGYVIDIPFNTTREQYLSVIREIVMHQWIDKATRVIFVEYFLFHRNSGMVLMAKHLIEVHAGGGISHTMMASPFHLDEASINDKSTIFVFSMFCLFCLIYSLRVLYRMMLTLQAYTWDPIRFVVLIFEEVNIVIFVFTAATYRGISLVAVGKSDPVWQIDHYPRSYESMFTMYDITAIANCLNIVLSLMLTLSYTQHMVSFRTVVRTLRRAAKPAVALGFVAFSILIGFAVCAAVTFGERILHYHTIGDSIASLLTLIWDSWNFDVLFTNDLRVYGAVFIVFFTIVFLLFLLNAVTAVFTDAFDDEGQEAFDPTNLMAIVASDYFAAVRKHSTWRSVFVWPLSILKGFGRSLMHSLVRKKIVNSATTMARSTVNTVKKKVKKTAQHVLHMSSHAEAAETRAGADEATNTKTKGVADEANETPTPTVTDHPTASTLAADPPTLAAQSKHNDPPINMHSTDANDATTDPTISHTRSTLPSVTFNEYNYYTQLYSDLWLLKEVSEGNSKNFEGAIRSAARMLGLVRKLDLYVPRMALDDLFVDKQRKCLFKYCEKELFDDEGVTDEDEPEDDVESSAKKDENDEEKVESGSRDAKSDDAQSQSSKRKGLSRRSSLQSNTNNEDVLNSTSNSLKGRAKSVASGHEGSTIHRRRSLTVERLLLGGSVADELDGRVDDASKAGGEATNKIESLIEEFGASSGKKHGEKERSPNIDYNLVMTLFAIVPQFEFGWSALDELLEAVSARKLWWKAARATTIVADRMERREARANIDRSFEESIKALLPKEEDSESEDGNDEAFDDDGADDDGADDHDDMSSELEDSGIFSLNPAKIGDGSPSAFNFGLGNIPLVPDGVGVAMAVPPPHNEADDDAPNVAHHHEQQEEVPRPLEEVSTVKTTKARFILDAKEFVPMLDHLERRMFLGIIASRFLNTDSKYVDDDSDEEMNLMAPLNLFFRSGMFGANKDEEAAAVEEANADRDTQGPNTATTAKAARSWAWLDFFGADDEVADDDSAKLLNKRLFYEIVRSLQDRSDASLLSQGKLLPSYIDASLLWKALALPSDEHCLRFRDLLPLIQIEFGPQTLGFRFSLDETLAFSRAAQQISDSRFLKQATIARQRIENIVNAFHEANGSPHRDNNDGIGKDFSSGDFNSPPPRNGLEGTSMFVIASPMKSTSDTLAPTPTRAKLNAANRWNVEANDEGDSLRDANPNAKSVAIKGVKGQLNLTAAHLASASSSVPAHALATAAPSPVNYSPRNTEEIEAELAEEAEQQRMEALAEKVKMLAPMERILPKKFLTEEEFAEAWTIAKGSAPSMRDLSHIMNIFPKDCINWQLFAHACQGEPTAINRTSFPTVLASSLCKQHTYQLSYFVYLPTLAIYFIHLLLLTQGDAVQIAVSLRRAFVPESPAGSRDDVAHWLKDAVIGGIWAGNDEDDGINGTSVNATIPKARSVDNEGNNYFVGALRVMQWRVAYKSRDECEKLYETYFGEKEALGVLRLPTKGEAKNTHLPLRSVRPEIMAFYERLVESNHPDLLSLRCVGNWNVGRREATAFYGGKKENGGPPIEDAVAGFGSLHPISQQAFFHREMGHSMRHVAAASTEGHDDAYGPAGFFFDIPYSLGAQEVHSIVDDVLSNGWIDQQTRMVAMRSVVYNQNLQIAAVARTGYELSSGGNMAPTGHIDMLAIRQPHDSWLDTTSVLLFLFAVLYFLRNCQEIFIVLRRRRVLGSWNRSSSFAIVALDLGKWCNLLVHTIVVVIILVTSGWHLYWWSVGTLPSDMTVHNDGEYPENIEYYAHFSGFVRGIEGMNYLVLTMLCTIFVTTTIRFEIILETIAVSYKDLLAIGSLFVIVVVAFTCGMQLLWGYELEFASSFGGAFINMFIGATSGNGISEDLFPPRKFIGNLFQLFFVIISNIILNNTVTGRISSAFKTVKENKYQSAVTAASIERYDVFTRHDGLDLLMPENRKLFSRKWWKKIQLSRMLFNFFVRRSIAGSFAQIVYTEYVSIRRIVKRCLRCVCCKKDGEASSEDDSDVDLAGVGRLRAQASRRAKANAINGRHAENASRAEMMKKKKNGKSLRRRRTETSSPAMEKSFMFHNHSLQMQLRDQILNRFRFSISHYWSSMEEWWLMVDCGMPFEAAIGGAHLIGLRHATPEIEAALDHRADLYTSGKRQSTDVKKGKDGGAQNEKKGQEATTSAPRNESDAPAEAQGGKGVSFAAGTQGGGEEEAHGSSVNLVEAVGNAAEAIGDAAVKMGEGLKEIGGNIADIGTGLNKLISDTLPFHQLFSAQKALLADRLAKRTRLSTFGTFRRLPLWEELLYDKLQDNEGHTGTYSLIRDYFLTIPALLYGMSERAMGLEILEEKHYYDQEQLAFGIESVADTGDEDQGE